MPISSKKHDCIALSEVPTMDNSEKGTLASGDYEKTGKGLNLKATELRLGLPGSESPDRDDYNGNGLLLKCLVSGAKRGFSDTMKGGSGKWCLSVGVGSDCKDGSLFSPRGANGAGGLEKSNTVKEAVPQSPKPTQEKKPQSSAANGHGAAPAAKAQVVGWPPIRSYRKNSMAVNPPKVDEDADTKSGAGCLYVKVSMDGAPYLRKVDLRTYNSYKDLSSALEKMFSSFTTGQCSSQGIPTQDSLSDSRFKDLLRGSEYVLTFEDKDGDWMLVGDVPWVMFTDSCKRLRIMKSSDAIGLAPRGVEKCKS